MANKAANVESPRHLSKEAKALWRDVVDGRAWTPPQLEVLRMTLEARDRAEEAREIVARDGPVTKTRTTGALHVHPLLKVERESRAQFFKGYVLLGLHRTFGSVFVEPEDFKSEQVRSLSSR